jgi:hypothetical protein
MHFYPSAASRSPANSYWLLASSKTADTAQPAQRVSQAEPPLFFFLMFFMYASSSDGFRLEAI